MVLPIGLSVALIGGISHVAKAQGQQSTQEQTEITPESELTVRKAEYVMQHCANEEEIIQWYGLDNIAQRVTYNPETRRNNFENLVLNSRIPSVVMFYERTTDENAKGVKGQNREFILFCEAVLKYSPNVNFVCFEIDVDPALAYNSHKGLIDQFKIQAAPSIALYSLFDLLRGETSQENDGRIKQVDILRGSPAKTSSLPSWFYGSESMSDWIETNLFLNPAKNYVIRVNNSSTPQTVLLENR